MTKLTALLRILHVAALGVAVLSFGLAVLAWLTSHRSAGASELKDIASLGGLFSLGGLLLGGFNLPLAFLFCRPVL